MTASTLVEIQMPISDVSNHAQTRMQQRGIIELFVTA
jgi:hypothetical protein